MIEKFVEISLPNEPEMKADIVKSCHNHRVLVQRAGNEFPDAGRIQYGLLSEGFGLVMNDGGHIFPYEDMRMLYVSRGIEC